MSNDNQSYMRVFYYVIDDDTLIGVNRSLDLCPPDIIEITGYNKKVFYKDWEIEEKENGQQQETKTT